MKNTLDINVGFRAVPTAADADVPLITLAWRALRGEYRRNQEERVARESVHNREIAALADLAEQVYRLRRAEQAGVLIAGDIMARLERILIEELGVSTVAPVNVPYTPEMMDLIDNIAQRPTADASVACIAEIVTPAIFVRGTMVRMGKAIIAIPPEGD